MLLLDYTAIGWLVLRAMAGIKGKKSPANALESGHGYTVCEWMSGTCCSRKRPLGWVK